MPSLVIIGVQWGDEGKGKIVDALAGQADVVVRFQGGDNAGHTVFHDGRKFVFHILPSGILRPRVMNLIGGGVVVNPKSWWRNWPPSACRSPRGASACALAGKRT